MITHPEIVAVDMATSRDRSRRHPDKLAIAAHRVTDRQIIQGELVTARNLIAGV